MKAGTKAGSRRKRMDSRAMKEVESAGPGT